MVKNKKIEYHGNCNDNLRGRLSTADRVYVCIHSSGLFPTDTEYAVRGSGLKYIRERRGRSITYYKRFLLYSFSFFFKYYVKNI